MPAGARTLIVNRPAEEVFAFFADPANDLKWRPHVKEISARGPVEVGAKIHQVIAGPGGRGIPADIEVTAYEPAARYAFRVIAGPARPTGEFLFAPDDNGTSVTFSLQAQLSGVKRLFLARPVQTSIDGEMAALDTAKALIESG